MNSEKVSVIIVSFNSERDLSFLLPSLSSQTYRNLEVILVDNASVDRSVEITRRHFPEAIIIRNERNRGFASAVNQGISLSSGEFILLLNPDTFLESDFIERLVVALKNHPEAGGACGKLLNEDGSGIDSAGIFFSPFMRHFDRGQGEAPASCERECYVFGVSGAAALLRRKMLEDVKVRGEYLDSSFFAYREDADLSWRARLMGWSFIYVPSARGRHRRRVFPGRRRGLPSEINMHSVKNRFLMRVKNQTFLHFLFFLIPALIRDAGIILYMLLFERESLPALREFLKLLPSAIEARREIMKKKRVSSLKLIRWFLWKKEESLSLKIAFMGTRGVPAGYSGFETFVEQLGKRLASSHRIYVYNRSHHIKFRERYYLGMRLFRFPTIPTKHTDTIVHTLLSVIHGAFMGYDIVYICGVGNSILSFIPGLYGAKVVLNVDGKDWSREKWGRFARWFLRISERLATFLPDVVIADSRAVEDYYLENYRKKTIMIPYGAEMRFIPPSKCLQRFGIEPRKYILFVGRLVPENGAHILIEAYRRLKTSFPLVIVGDAPYVERYKEKLYRMAREVSPPGRVVFTGFLLGDDYMEISSHPYFYVLASAVGGTHPVLVEQMRAGNCVLVNSLNPANIEVVGESGFYFDGKRGSEDLKEKMEFLLKNPDEVKRKGEMARRRAEELYSWERITEKYRELFLLLKSGIYRVYYGL